MQVMLARGFRKQMVPEAGLEPARRCRRGILRRIRALFTLPCNSPFFLVEWPLVRVSALFAIIAESCRKLLVIG